MRTPLLRSQLGDHRLMCGSRPYRGRDALLSQRQVVRTPNGMEFMLNSVSLKPQYSSPGSIHILLHPCYRSTESGVVLHGCDPSICGGRGWGCRQDEQGFKVMFGYRGSLRSAKKRKSFSVLTGMHLKFLITYLVCVHTCVCMNVPYPAC